MYFVLRDLGMSISLSSQNETAILPEDNAEWQYLCV
jgi:hypothetical protein